MGREGQNTSYRAAGEKLDYDTLLDKISLALEDYKTRAKVDDLRKATQTVFTAGLMYVGYTVFADHSPLLQRQAEARGAAPRFVEYSREEIEMLCELYAYICSLYDKICTLYGFARFSCLGMDFVEDRAKTADYITSCKAWCSKKLSEIAERTAADYIADGKHNPVGTFGYLNRFFGWNQPGVTREIKEVKALDINDLPKLLD